MDSYLNATKVPSYYTNGNRILAIWHSRLRNQCSSLNFDLYNNHVANDPSCECDEEIEDAVNFFFECQRYDIQRTVLFNATRNFHPLSINIFLFGNPDLSDQDNQIIFDAVHSFIKSSRRFNIDIFIVFFYLHILFATVLLTFRFRNFVLSVGSQQTKNLFDLFSYLFFFRLLHFLPILYGCCCSFSFWKQFHHPFVV